MNAESIPEHIVESRVVADQLAKHKERLFDQIRADTKAMLASMPPADVLSFHLMSEDRCVRSVRIEATKEYCQVLIAFMRGRSYKEYQVESFVTPKVMAAVEKAIVAFYSHPEISAEIGAILAQHLDTFRNIGAAIRTDLAEDQAWMKREAAALLKTNLAESVSTEMASNVVHNVHAFVHSAAGKTLLASIGKLLATGAGKVLAAKVAVVVGHVVATSAFHTVVLAIVKKVGVTVLVKVAIGKAIIAILALLGISASIPIVYIILPIIAAVLAWEYKHLPAKLADKVPGEICTALSGKFDELNEQICQELIRGVMVHIMTSEAA